MLTASELAALASQTYGNRWQSALARDFGVNIRTVQRWAVDGIAKQSTADNVRRFLSGRRVILAASSDVELSDADRDEACHDSLEPIISAVAQAAQDQGWHPAEIWVAITSIAAENVCGTFGRQHAIEMLQQAIDLLENAHDA